MTNRNRRNFRSFRGGRRRTSRKVWVNRSIGSTLVVDTDALIDVLSSSEEFMKFDATILAVHIAHLFVTVTVDATVTNRRVGAALLTGHENLDSIDITEGPLDSGVGPAWLWQQSVAVRTVGAGEQGFNIVSAATGGINVRAKRRFTENNETLWLLIDNEVEAGDTLMFVDGFLRTLLLIP